MPCEHYLFEPITFFMEATNTTVLLLNRVPHELSMILMQAKMAPIVTVRITDVHPLPHCGGPAESLVEHRPVTPEATEGELVLFRQNGGYTILLGRQKWEALASKPVDEATGKKRREEPGFLKGRLLSTPALKKCRVVVQAAEPMEEVRPLDRGARTYHRDDSYQGNRPRVVRLERESDRPYFPEYDRQPRRA